ncbi:hypothetical protein HK405_002734, partial [Cladochytrium tenue]
SARRRWRSCWAASSRCPEAPVRRRPRRLGRLDRLDRLGRRQTPIPASSAPLSSACSALARTRGRTAWRSARN